MGSRGELFRLGLRILEGNFGAKPYLRDSLFICLQLGLRVI
jgi:hypothetical protein